MIDGVVPEDIQARDEYIPTFAELYRLYLDKYDGKGWGPAMRLRHQHFSPDDYYEALVLKVIKLGCKWADVGCGRDIFPSNAKLAEKLASRAFLVFGIDPDPNIQENRFVTEWSQSTIEGCETPHKFDVITLRMVAEHIENPDATMAKIATMLKPDGLLVIYTPYKWSPMSVAASVVPFSWHNPLKWLLWRTEAQDTFPTVYALNTRGDLRRHTSANGLQEVAFKRLDDCRVTGRYRLLQWIELKTWKMLRAISLPYPEACLLAVYRKN